MQVDPLAPYQVRVGQALADPNLRTALDRATTRLSTARTAAMASIDEHRLKTEANAVRRFAVRNLPDLLEDLERNLIANGVHVHWARDASEAGATVRRIAADAGVQRVVKSKSMVTEEIHLNEVLERDGIRVVETDLGEYIIQLAHEPPSHIIAPVIHKRVEDVSALFQRELGTPPTDDPQVLCGAARVALRDEFLRADMGISGCNFAIAESGTMCIITNEGNGRMVSSMPRVYVVVVGIEKVVPTVEDAVLLWQAAARSATGQHVSVYFTMSSGPRTPDQPDGPEEMHVVLLDNGRSRVLERGYGDALLCIRCGACLNACPVYREIGGHTYGRTAYNGPIGAVITPLLANDPATVRDLPFASSLCGACRDACPVKIDLPRLLLDLRADLTAAGTSLPAKRWAMRAFAAGTRQPGRYVFLTRVIRRLLPGWDGGKAGWRNRLPVLNVWGRARDFPGFARQSFREWWERRADAADVADARDAADATDSTDAALGRGDT